MRGFLLKGFVASGLALLGTSAWANINLVYLPANQTVAVGDTVNIDVFAVSDSMSNQGFAACDILAVWDNNFLNPISYTNAGAGYVWGNSGFLFPTLNGSLNDGNAEWSGECQLGGPFPTSTPVGLKLTTLRFTAITTTASTAVVMPTSLSGRTTRIFHQSIPNTNVLGSVSANAFVTIIPPATNITGTLYLQDTAFTAPFTRTIQGTVKQGTTTVGSFAVSGINASTYAFSSTVPGTYSGPAQLYFDGASFLKRRVDIVLNNGTMNVGQVNLVNGDVVDTNEVDLSDIDQTIAEYGTGGDLVADVDIDGEVTLTDIDIVIINYGIGGDL